MQIKTQEINDFLLYTTADGKVKIDVVIHGQTIRMPQKKMAELFGVNVPAISKHLANIFETWELSGNWVISILETTADDGKTYQTKFYNLDAIIAVGYRVNSHQATQFRIWATKVLNEYIIKGFAMDDERLKQWRKITKDYFDELLERIREIRASERRFYQKITDIYATAVDYDVKSEITKQFFAIVQNKMHRAIHQHTASEVIIERASATKPNMWLTHWKLSPTGKVLKSDVSIAKNYLTEKEIKELNRIVSMYIDYAERQAMIGQIMTMQDWREKLDIFLKYNNYEILENAGKISHEIAKEFAEKEFEEFRILQDKAFESDFDSFAKIIEDRGNV